jgi:hypothetical protein
LRAAGASRPYRKNGESLDGPGQGVPADFRYEAALACLASARGVIYDTLHLQCAEGAGCHRLHTYNLRDFQGLDPQNIALLAP